MHEPAVRPWELELLLSLSLTFGLMQLPAQVDEVFWAMEPHLDRGMRTLAFVVYEFVKLPLYLMISAFLLHLPTAELPRGENVLEVAAVPRVGEDARTRPARQPTVIPFWR